MPNSAVVIAGQPHHPGGPAGQVQVPAGAQVIDAQRQMGHARPDRRQGATGTGNMARPFLIWGVTSRHGLAAARNNQGIAERDAINARRLSGAAALPDGRQASAARDRWRTGPTITGPGDGNRIVETSEEAVAHVRANRSTAGADFITFANGDGPPNLYDAGRQGSASARQGRSMFRAMGPQTRATRSLRHGQRHRLCAHRQCRRADRHATERNGRPISRLPPDAYSDMDEAKVEPMIRMLVACNAYLEPDLMGGRRGFHKNWARVQQEEPASSSPIRTCWPITRSTALRGRDGERESRRETYLTPEQLEMRAPASATRRPS